MINKQTHTPHLPKITLEELKNPVCVLSYLNRAISKQTTKKEKRILTELNFSTTNLQQVRKNLKYLKIVVRNATHYHANNHTVLLQCFKVSQVLNKYFNALIKHVQNKTDPFKDL